jgi:hypothetical protein
MVTTCPECGVPRCAYCHTQKVLSCDRILIKFNVHALGLPCRAGVSMVASLGSICKAGDVDSRCGGREKDFICSDMSASSKATGWSFKNEKTVCTSAALL